MKSTKIIFLSYVNRSGSTYLANILSSSPAILACPEGDMLVRELLEDPGSSVRSPSSLMHRLNHHFMHDSKLASWEMPQLRTDFIHPGNRNIDVFISLLDSYRDRIKPEATKIVFKAERLVFLFDKLFNITHGGYSFQFLTIVRDPRAVFHSQSHTRIPETGKKMAENPVYAGIYWNRHTRYADKLERTMPVYIMQYENLVQNFTRELENLSGFLKNDAAGFSPEKGDLLRRLPEDHRGIHRLIDEKPRKDKLTAWQDNLVKRETAAIETVAATGMAIIGYQPVSGISSKRRYLHFALFYYTLYHLLRMIRIIVFRVKRLINISC